MNDRIYINDGWQFFEDFSQELTVPGRKKGGVEVRIPHTVKEIPFHYFDEKAYQMTSGYRKTFKAQSKWKGKRIIVTFDAVAHEAEVFLNGKSLLTHRCGYTAFSVDLTDSLNWKGENVLAVKVNSREDINVPPFGFVIDYLTYGGIYRDVYLEIKNPVYLADVFLKPSFDVKTGECTLSTEYSLGGIEGDSHVKYSIRQFIASHKTEEFTPIENPEADASLGRLKTWSPEDPNLYDIKTQLLQVSDGTVVDEKTIAVGFRKAEFTKNGFFLNGNYYKIRGLNRHQSYPYVGYAMPESMQKMDARVLKYELGVNAVRTSHYPDSHYFLDACDELGLLVFTEIPGWQNIGNDEWKNHAVENVREMVTQYRNHTSIVLWGVRINESRDDDEFYRRTNEVAHMLDATRQTGGVKAHKKASTFEDVYNYNDFSHHGPNEGCLPKKKVVPDMKLPYFISEYNGHMFPTKSFDCEEHRVEHALRHARVLNSVASHDDICGSFGWCMADYNTHKDFGSGDKICYHGVLDMWRNPKTAASVYSSQQDEFPVLEIASSMDIGEHPAGFRGDTYILTNADSVRMYKNDLFIKEYAVSEHTAFKNIKHGPIVIDDYVGDQIEKDEKMKRGQAEALKTVLNEVARNGMFKLPCKALWNAMKLVLFYRMNFGSVASYFTKYIGDWGGKSTVYKFEAIRGGKVVKTVIKKPVAESVLSIDVSHTALREKSSYDVACVRIKAVDIYGNILNFYNEPITLRTKGPIEIIGPKIISLQGGMFGTYVKTTGKAGRAVLFIESERDKSLSVEFNVEV